MAQLARVLAYDDYVQEASAAQLHRLRIRFKWLRYTLDFLTPVLGNEVLTLTGQLNEIQDHFRGFPGYTSRYGDAKPDPTGRWARWGLYCLPAGETG